MMERRLGKQQRRDRRDEREEVEHAEPTRPLLIQSHPFSPSTMMVGRRVPRHQTVGREPNYSLTHLPIGRRTYLLTPTPGGEGRPASAQTARLRTRARCYGVY